MRMEKVYKKTALAMIAGAYLLSGWLILITIIEVAK